MTTALTRRISLRGAAATKIEQSGTVRYEVAGVDLDALS